MIQGGTAVRRPTVFDGHPAVNFLFFALMIGFTMFLNHPVYLLISLAGAVLCLLGLRGWRAVLKIVGWLLPSALVTALINGLFNHAGQTALFRLPDGNAVTLEALLSGASSAVLLAAVMLWFFACSDVITSDQLLYLFGRILPSASLLISMTLRMVPRFSRQLTAIREAQQGMGVSLKRGSLRQRFRNGTAMLSALITWALEDAVETADSMKSRGHGLPGRTAYSQYHMESRDKWLLGGMAVCGLHLLCGVLAGGMRWQWYPVMQSVPADPVVIWLAAVFGGLSLLPVWSMLYAMFDASDSQLSEKGERTI